MLIVGKKCKLPDDTLFKTKPQLAFEMLGAVSRENALSFKYVLADSIYGVNPEFIEAVESLPDKLTSYRSQKIRYAG